LVFAFPVLFVLIFFIVKFAAWDFYHFLIEEDSVFEFMQVIFYLLASFFFLMASARSFRAGKKDLFFIYLVLGLGLAFVCAEELSWGQRIVDFKNPLFFARHNVQKEVTIHNLSAVQPFLHLGYILTGFVGASGWFFIRMSGRYKWIDILPGWYLSSYFAPVFFIYLYFEISFHLGDEMSNSAFSESYSLLGWRDQELAELILSLGFFLFAYISGKRAVSLNSGMD